MVYYNSEKLLSLKDGDILFFDEVLNGNPATLAACLTILEGRRMISGKSLPDIMIVAAANPQGMTPLTPQIKERFLWYEVKFNRKMWIDFMVKKYKISYSIGTRLSNLITDEDFTGYNFMTSRSIDKNLGMIIKGVKTPYYSKLETILKEPITNEKADITLSDGTIFRSGETKDWLSLIKDYEITRK